MNDSIQLADRIVRNRSKTTHVMRFQLLDSDIDEGEICQNRPGGGNIGGQRFHPLPLERMN